MHMLFYIKKANIPTTPRTAMTLQRTLFSAASPVLDGAAAYVVFEAPLPTPVAKVDAVAVASSVALDRVKVLLPIVNRLSISLDVVVVKAAGSFSDTVVLESETSISRAPDVPLA